MQKKERTSITFLKDIGPFPKGTYELLEKSENVLICTLEKNMLHIQGAARENYKIRPFTSQTRLISRKLFRDKMKTSWPKFMAKNISKEVM